MCPWSETGYIQGYYFSRPVPAEEFEQKCLDQPVVF